MGSIVTTIFSGVGETIKGMASGIADAFKMLLWQGVDNGTGTIVYDMANGLSDFAQFGFMLFGIGLAMGLVYLVIRLIKK